MKLNRYGRVAALLGAGVLALAACGNDPTGNNGDSGNSGSGGGNESSLSGELGAGGASSQEAAMQAWMAGFQENNPDVTLSYDPIGSGGGRTQFIDGAFPFAGTDAALDEKEAADAEERCGGEAMHLPVYVSPIAVVFNLDGVDDLQLSPDTLAQIFDGKITKWNDQAIAKDNPDAKLPNQKITPVHRSDESGTTENFVDYLSAAAPDSWKHEVSGDWPVSGGQSGKGTSGLVQTVQGGNGTIGYADASQAGDLGVASIKVGEEFVEYSPEAAAKIVEVSPRAEGVGENNIQIDLERDSTESGVYPIVLVSYLLACPTYDDAAEGELTKEFLNYIASEDGQQQAAEGAGSAPLSESLRSDVQAAIDSIEVGSDS